MKVGFICRECGMLNSDIIDFSDIHDYIEPEHCEYCGSDLIYLDEVLDEDEDLYD